MMINTAAALQTQVEPSVGGPTKGKTFSPLSKDRLEFFRQKLLEMSQDKIELATHLKEALRENGDHVFGTHQEWGTDTQSTNITAIQQDLCNKGSKEIEASLIRIQNGIYGKCKMCKGNIEEGRLEAIPTTEICGDCSGAKRRV